MAIDVNEEPTHVGPRVTLAAAPHWVELPPLEIPATPDPAFVIEGLCVLLEDVQVNLCGPEPAVFCRRADLIVDVSGVSHAARFGPEFDPTFERMEIHAIRIHRNGATLLRGGPSDFEILRRERNLEMRQFDGRQTVHLDINDVRVGDVVETLFTIHGEHPATAGRFADWRMFEWPMTGQLETRYRLLAPATRTFTVRHYGGAPPQYEERALDGAIDRRWRATRRIGGKIEPLAPAATIQLARVQITEWRDWSELADRFAPAYDETGALPSDLDAKVQEFKSLSDPAARAAALLHFIQREIRYLAISIGLGGLIPRPLAAIWETRFGDCKDVSKLFVTLARRLGLDAAPALVHTVAGDGIADLAPTPGAFDHCIVRLRIGWSIYWLDATRSPQPSPLATLYQPRFGFALALTPDAKLEHMGADPLVTVCETNERITLPDRISAPGAYTLTIVSRSYWAEAVRANRARSGEVAHTRETEDRVKQVWPQARCTGTSLDDDVPANVITETLTFEVPEIWEEADDNMVRFRTNDLVIGNRFAPLPPGPVRHPIYLGGIQRVTRSLTIQFPVKWPTDSVSNSVIENEASVLLGLVAVSDREVRIEQELKIRNSLMPPALADRYRAMASLLAEVDYVLITKRRKDKVLSPSGGGFDWRIILWAYLATVAVGFVIRLIADW